MYLWYPNIFHIHYANIVLGISGNTPRSSCGILLGVLPRIPLAVPSGISADISPDVSMKIPSNSCFFSENLLWNPS